jgi:hypothetical protein
MTRPKGAAKPKRGLLTPHQFAFRVESTVKDLMRLHAQGTFAAFVPGGIGRGKQRLYREEQISDFLRLFGRRSSLDVKNEEELLKLQETQSHVARLHLVPFTGDQAKTGFLALGAGKNFTDLVIEHGFHPDIARSIALSWSEMNENIVLSKSSLDAITLLPLDGPMPPKTEADVLAILKLAADEAQCRSCKRGLRAVCCKRCVLQALFEARQEEREKVQPPQPSSGASTPGDELLQK